MKFARYLQDTQVPEWKKAYIDYRGLKVQLGVIRAQTPQQLDASSSVGTDDVEHIPHPAPIDEEKPDDSKDPGDATPPRIPSLDLPGADLAISTAELCRTRPVSSKKRKKNERERPSLGGALAGLSRRLGTASSARSHSASLRPKTPRNSPILPLFRDPVPPAPLPLNTILPGLPATHAKFFEMLDAELDKVEKFYAEREKEMQERDKRLREQLNELGVHRQIVHSSIRRKTQRWRKSIPSALSSLVQWSPGPIEPSWIRPYSTVASESGRGEIRGSVDASKLGPPAIERKSLSGDQSRFQKKEGERGPDSLSRGDAATSSRAPGEATKQLRKRSSSLPRLSFVGPRDPLDPQEYQHAKRRLRKAVIEHYRGLEVLNNYRILNLTGFRKALKKYDKITNNVVLESYMKEKVAPSTFAAGSVVSTMLKEMEDMFAMRFERGDRKRAMERLRVGPSSKTHHFSTFRSGLWLGLALPAIAWGSYLSFQEETRESLQSLDILIFIYSVFLVPLLLALLIGLNIAVWAHERINYVFIFELNPRLRLDHHEYFELPSILLCTLAYAFWFSLAQLGPPFLWPLLWLVLTFVIMFNPIRGFMWGRARWWMIKSIAKLGASGVWRVEFTDFWLGDQLSSLVYSHANMFFVGCFYTHYSGLVLPGDDTQSQDGWSKCGMTQNWGWYYLFAALPFTVRFVQSLRRYGDSKLPTHVINAGKYGMGLIYYFFYFYWRHQDSPHMGASYVLWLSAATVYALYGCAWDFLMDWSLLRPYAGYPLLRKELIYKSRIPSYYFALISNLCIRFLWVTYIPSNGPSTNVRTFIVAILEMLRRVQWNFYRLENEHLGNMDQYRVTRDLPLPYSFDMPCNEEEREEEEDEEVDEDEGERGEDTHGAGSWLRQRMARPRRNGGHG